MCGVLFVCLVLFLNVWVYLGVLHMHGWSGTTYLLALHPSNYPSLRLEARDRKTERICLVTLSDCKPLVILVGHWFVFVWVKFTCLFFLGIFPRTNQDGSSWPTPIPGADKEEGTEVWDLGCLWRNCSLIFSQHCSRRLSLIDSLRLWRLWCQHGLPSSFLWCLDIQAREGNISGMLGGLYVLFTHEFQLR